MKSWIFLIMLLALASQVVGQEHDNVWYMGYSFLDDPQDTAFGTSVIDFSELSFPEIFYDPYSKIDFNDTNASISDAEGNFLFTFNGQYIEDASGQKMLNGDQINPYDDNDFGYDLPQGGIVLPWPEGEGRYVLFHQVKDFVEELGIVGGDLRYSIVEMELNNNLGAVIEKRVVLLEEPLSNGQLTATRHANGRDWWLLVCREESNEYFRILLTPEKVLNLGVQSIGTEVKTGLGQACFSPDGQWYVRFNTISTQLGQFIDIYQFDRCTGELSNHQRIHYNENAASGGVAISPSSRYLYISSYLHIYQYDLWSEDIEASRDTVAVYDGFLEQVFFATRFYLAQLAPDGKIYLSCPNGVVSLHVIHNPDERGEACNVEQRGVQLPTYNASSIPNFPNYRLGPIDGSPCDTLGIDNLPLARWRYAQDTLEPFQVAFTDLSAYEPVEWLWEFGDGTVSQDTSPAHLFPEDGLYEVCLTVSNANGSDTKCRQLQLGMVSGLGPVPETEFQVRVFPNPFLQWFTVCLPEGWLPRDARLHLYDGLGRLALSRRLWAGANEVIVESLPPGVYFYAVEDSGGVVAQGRVVKERP